MAHSRSVQIALDAAKQLEGEGIDCEVGLRHSNQTSNSNVQKMIVSISALTKLPEINIEFCQYTA